MSNDESAGKISKAYSEYLACDRMKEMIKIDECIEETLTRLEELENGIKMHQNEREKLGSVDFSRAQCNLNALCQRVHKLDEMSSRVLEDLDKMKVVLDEAESSLINNTEAKLKSLLKPLSFMKSDSSLPSTLGQMSSKQFSPPSGFKASSFFSKQEEDQASSSKSTS